MSPTEGFAGLPRSWAEADIRRRKAKLKADLLALPPAERFRLVADLLDAGQTALARKLAEFATRDLTTTKPGGRS